MKKRNTWGGARKGAGRKPAGQRAGLPHRSRPALASRFPVHVTLRVRPHVWNLRSRRAFDGHIGPAIDAVNAREDFRLVHYSVQGNHMHLVCEARDGSALSRGIQALSIRIARGLNRMMGCKGPVFADRYHGRILRSPREVRNVLRYVLRNFGHHARQWAPPDGMSPEVWWDRAAERHRRRTGRAEAAIDPYSSARHFDGWRRLPELPRWGPRDPPRGAPPGTWLLGEGWRRAGPIEPG